MEFFSIKITKWSFLYLSVNNFHSFRRNFGNKDRRQFQPHCFERGLPNCGRAGCSYAVSTKSRCIVDKVRAWRIEAEQIVQARLASTNTASNSASTASTTSTSASASSAPDGEMIELSLDNPFNMALKRYHGSVSGEQAFLEDNSQRDLSPRNPQTL